MFAAKQARPSPAPGFVAPAPRVQNRRHVIQGCGDHECDCRPEVRRQREAALQPSLVPPSIREVVSGAGQPLDARFRTQAETRLGFDFSSVRVHADSAAASSARQIGAAAYTVGNHIVFGRGRFPPVTAGGQRLVNHELTHVAQQGATMPTADLVLGAERDPAEAEADEVAAGLTGGPSLKARPPAVGAVRRQTLEADPEAGAGRATQPPPDSTAWERFKSQGPMLSRMFTENRYGCWCGPGNVCPEVRDPIDACCKAHDEGYARVGVSSTPKPGEVDMWSADGFIRTMEIDKALVGCTQTAQQKDKRLGAAQLYVTGVSLIFGTRVSIANAIQNWRVIASIPKAVGEQLFLRPILIARASVDPANWDLSPMTGRSRTDLAVVGAYLWSQLHPDEPNDFVVRVAQPLSSYAIPRPLLESIAQGVSAAASGATGFNIEFHAEELASLSPVVFVQTLHDWRALRFRVDPKTSADAMLARSGRSGK